MVPYLNATAEWECKLYNIACLFVDIMLYMLSLSLGMHKVGRTLRIGPSVTNDLTNDPSVMLKILVRLLDEPAIN